MAVKKLSLIVQLKTSSAINVFLHNHHHNQLTILSTEGLGAHSKLGTQSLIVYYLFQVSNANMSVITDSIDLEREYSPSRWSTRFATASEVLQHHVQFVTAGNLFKC